MGCYINPPAADKEVWLLQNAEFTLEPCEITETHVPVCLVDNGAFKAAAVGFNQGEVDAFAYDDGRFKLWFKLSREKARAVSDLANWEKERGRTR